MPADDFFVRWNGVMVPPVSGPYDLGVRLLGQFRLWLDDTLFTEFSDRHVEYTQTRRVQLTAGKPYRINLEYSDRRTDASVQLVWCMPMSTESADAISAAREADVVIIVLGLTPRLEGEELPVKIEGFLGGDRTSLDLPRPQEELLKSIVATGKPVVLVLLNGSALGLNWASENVPAIVEAWYPGQAAGTAVADVIFGKANPAGRLPVTFYRSVDQLPPFSDYSMAGRTYRYFKGTPVYPFGYGLSYTTFNYEDLRIPSSLSTGDTTHVSALVRNSGSRAGEEVVQLYVSLDDGQASSPIRSLKGFQRVYLEAGESRRVEFVLTPTTLSAVDDAGVLLQAPGIVRVSIGGEQPGMSGRQDAGTTQTVTGTFRVGGRKIVFPDR
jgi:beta-glucosidase